MTLGANSRSGAATKTTLSGHCCAMPCRAVVRPHSSLGNQTPTEAYRTLEQFEGPAPGAPAQTDDGENENQTRKLSL